ncbi:MAG: restriction endonuclease subunit R [Moorea sp. SIO3I7]|uniref:restriction endonuclease subunit R n=1 Tax=unclassified Moorena TaxID=2683338 RepID=UPI0013BF8B80|nr:MULTISPECIES: restriction endonuclease subunit R [unclassified Moorena]NEO03043.1 restriction endonuclease subunit R [Moorena sp. SIO3I7]NEO05977.1 restriction endonuclease subunit R [Moorena sp. SIO3I8]NEO21064.1 restriction endonuclease subunit R [Moorena sp. SIO4A5]NEP27799.1 restriction endonuclease subunit R [Moorena sp. SIO3I6]NEQ61643.1 restriction endonuclease subunit R [Moorena sp. SIO4A1]
MTIIQASHLSLEDVHHTFGFQRQYNSSLTSRLSLDTITEFEQRELEQIRTDFDNYLIAGKVSEGLVKALTVFPLLRLAGFYRSPIKISLEEEIADIDIQEQDTKITGRLDILAINKAQQTVDKVSFWVLVIETKNSSADVSVGLPQLLTYAYKSLDHQDSVWGLSTNGYIYQFIYLQAGNPPIYQLMPVLNLMESESSIKLLQVIKAIALL